MHLVFIPQGFGSQAFANDEELVPLIPTTPPSELSIY
jgi:hypothetical protein